MVKEFFIWNGFMRSKRSINLRGLLNGKKRIDTVVNGTQAVPYGLLCSFALITLGIVYWKIQ